MAERDRSQRRRLVQTAAQKLRDLILARPPGAQIGSLAQVSALLGVGIVTVQQAARILEHEGLLAVRRGPGGGYYGTRPDEEALERALASFMRVHGGARTEAREIGTLLDCELAARAAACSDEALHTELRRLGATIARRNSAESRIAFEADLRNILFRMDARPLLELISKVAFKLRDPEEPALYPGARGVAAWKAQKERLIAAILKRDAELARFEAERHRKEMLTRGARSKPARVAKKDAAG